MSPQRYTARSAGSDPLHSLVRVHLSRPSRVHRFDLLPEGRIEATGGYSAYLYAVEHGTVYLHYNGLTRAVREGEALLLTRDVAHAIMASATPVGTAAAPVHALEPPPGTTGSSGPKVVCHTEDTAAATVICVPLTAAGGERSPFFDLLPDHIVHTPNPSDTRAMVRWLTRTCEERWVGDTALALLYAEILTLLVLQEHFTGEHRSTLRVLHDPRLMRAISALHERLDHPWTVRELSRVAGMSESLFRSRLRAAVGEPWRSYVQRVRIRRAQMLLTMPDAAVAQVAANVGYLSESSFSRAFLTLVGVRPGQFIVDHIAQTQAGAPSPSL